MKIKWVGDELFKKFEDKCVGDELFKFVVKVVPICAKIEFVAGLRLFYATS